MMPSCFPMTLSGDVSPTALAPLVHVPGVPSYPSPYSPLASASGHTPLCGTGACGLPCRHLAGLCCALSVPFLSPSCALHVCAPPFSILHCADALCRQCSLPCLTCHSGSGSDWATRLHALRDWAHKQLHRPSSTTPGHYGAYGVTTAFHSSLRGGFMCRGLHVLRPLPPCS